MALQTLETQQRVWQQLSVFKNLRSMTWAGRIGIVLTLKMTLILTVDMKKQNNFLKLPISKHTTSG
jgi:hypothetical protein